MTAASPGGRPPVVKHTTWPIVKQLPTVLSINKEVTGFAINEVAREGYEFGICQLQLPNLDLALVTDPQMVKELFTSDDWGKEGLETIPTYELVRAAGGNGLFTADDSDPEWALAHRILTKPFSRQGMIAFVPLMNEMANLMITAMKTDIGFGGVAQIDEWSTKMAFETIAYCGMGMHFKTFELKEKHEFIRAMETFMSTTKQLALLPRFTRRFAFKRNQAFKESSATLKAHLAEVIKQRKAGLTKPPGDLPDLLELMLNSVDAVTNQHMSMENIAFQIITFLIAGHDSTASAMTGFLLEVTANPRVEALLVREIDEVVGDGDLRWEHLPRLTYLACCQKEALRLHPPAALVARLANRNTLLGGKWIFSKNATAGIPFIALHTNPNVWGPDAAVFRPERWENDAPPPHPFAYLPFAAGPRGCIGKEFSLLEQKIALVKLFQNFSMRMPNGCVPR